MLHGTSTLLLFTVDIVTAMYKHMWESNAVCLAVFLAERKNSTYTVYRYICFVTKCYNTYVIGSMWNRQGTYLWKNPCWQN